jgi:hypothetical protein
VASFSFYNNSNASISIGEYTTSGSFASYGSVGAHSSTGVSTYTGFIWAVFSSSGSCLGGFKVTASGGSVTVS